MSGSDWARKGARRVPKASEIGGNGRPCRTGEDPSWLRTWTLDDFPRPRPVELATHSGRPFPCVPLNLPPLRAVRPSGLLRVTTLSAVFANQDPKDAYARRVRMLLRLTNVMPAMPTNAATQAHHAPTYHPHMP